MLCRKAFSSALAFIAGEHSKSKPLLPGFLRQAHQRKNQRKIDAREQCVTLTTEQRERKNGKTEEEPTASQQKVYSLSLNAVSYQFDRAMVQVVLPVN